MSRYVYVAGPYTGDEERNVARALAAATDLLAAGLYPYVPHLSHYWEAQHAHHYEVWMELDFGWVRRCDAVLRLPGESKGADREVALAERLGLPIFKTTIEVVAWAALSSPLAPAEGEREDEPFTGPTALGDRLLRFLRRDHPDIDWEEPEDRLRDMLWTAFDEGRKSGRQFPGAAAPRPPSSPDPGERPPTHPCICGHAHLAGVDGEDGGCKDGDCTCRRWRCDHLLLPGNGACVRCGLTTEAIQCRAMGCARIPEDGSDFCFRHKGLPPAPSPAAAPPPGGEQYRFCDFTDCLRKPEPGSRYCYEHADRAPASQPEKKEGTT